MTRTELACMSQVIESTLLTAGVPQRDLAPVIAPLFDTLFNNFSRHDYFMVFEDVRPTLDILKTIPALKLAVISNSDYRTVKVLEALDLAGYFDFILTSYDAGFEKPDPGIFDEAIRKAGVRSEDALHVGDHEERLVGSDICPMAGPASSQRRKLRHEPAPA
ncbi:Haloacid dehalogenase-like hydrolase domain-containing protein 3 [Borealophlyctis nickersoniae]|nr:Haloacid dehalogenase-like hydrolase domain-containing protein 3 [Borealophlyctis nickersoniae]